MINPFVNSTQQLSLLPVSPGFFLPSTLFLPIGNIPLWKQ